MHPALLPAALVAAVALVMAGYVAAYREKATPHWLLLGALLSLLLWNLGTLCRFTVASEAGLYASLHLIFLGVFLTPPLWLALAASYARLPVAERPGAYALLFAPSLLAFVALLTNQGHGLVIREMSFAALERGGTAWTGPVFWAFLVWAWLCVGGGVAIYLANAVRMVAGDERRRGLLLAVASLIPLLVSPIYMLQLLPVHFDLTPSALLISLLISSAAVFRYRLLQSLPVARRDVIEQLEDGVVMASAAGVILDLNRAAQRILGHGAHALRRRLLADALAELAPADERPALREALAELAVRRDPVSAELRTADHRVIGVRAHRGRDTSGADAGQFAVLRDRTDERRVERLLRRTQRLQTAGTLAAGVAHEVNNPLAFIRANLSWIHRLGELAESGADAAKLRDELGDLRCIADETLDGIARIERIVGTMRGLSADAEEKGEELRTAVDVNRVLRDALRLTNLHRKHVVRVKLLLGEGLPPVWGVPERLVQAMLNLMLNAAQAAEEASPPRVSVASELDGDAVVLKVSDNGPGIRYEDQDRIFDPFFTTKGPDQGTGLGLSIAFDIVREHGGVLEVRSRPGRGAAFVVRLPLAQAPPTA